MYGRCRRNSQLVTPLIFSSAQQRLMHLQPCWKLLEPSGGSTAVAAPAPEQLQGTTAAAQLLPYATAVQLAASMLTPGLLHKLLCRKRQLAVF